MENKKYELDKVLIDINSNSDTKDNNMSTYIYNYARILEAFIKDINDLKNNGYSKKRIYGEMLEEFDIIDKFKKLVIGEVDRCVILNGLNSPISDTKSNKENKVKENTVSNNTIDLNELDMDKYGEIVENVNKVINEKKDNIYEEIDNTLDLNELIYKYGKYVDPRRFLYYFTKKDNTVPDNILDMDELINKFTADGKNCNKDIDINKEDNNVTKQKVNEPIKPKTIKPKEEYNTINNKVTLSSVYGTCRNSDILDEFDINNKEEDPLDDFEFVAEAFARLISKFNKGDI